MMPRPTPVSCWLVVPLFALVTAATLYVYRRSENQRAEIRGAFGQYVSPAIVDELIHERKITMRVLATPEKWFGITYKEDKPFVVAGIRRLIETGVYPEKLWD